MIEHEQTPFTYMQTNWYAAPMRWAQGTEIITVEAVPISAGSDSGEPINEQKRSHVIMTTIIIALPTYPEENIERTITSWDYL